MDPSQPHHQEHKQQTVEPSPYQNIQVPPPNQILPAPQVPSLPHSNVQMPPKINPQEITPVHNQNQAKPEENKINTIQIQDSQNSIQNQILQNPHTKNADSLQKEVDHPPPVEQIVNKNDAIKQGQCNLNQDIYQMKDDQLNNVAKPHQIQNHNISAPIQNVHNNQHTPEVKISHQIVSQTPRPSENLENINNTQIVNQAQQNKIPEQKSNILTHNNQIEIQQERNNQTPVFAQSINILQCPQNPIPLQQFQSVNAHELENKELVHHVIEIQGQKNINCLNNQLENSCRIAQTYVGSAMDQQRPHQQPVSETINKDQPTNNQEITNKEVILISENLHQNQNKQEMNIQNKQISPQQKINPNTQHINLNQPAVNSEHKANQNVDQNQALPQTHNQSHTQHTPDQSHIHLTTHTNHTTQTPNTQHHTTQIHDTLNKPDATHAHNKPHPTPENQITSHVQQDKPITGQQSAKINNVQNVQNILNTDTQQNVPQLTDINQIRKALLNFLPPHIKELAQTLPDNQLRQMYLQIRAQQMKAAAAQNQLKNEANQKQKQKIQAAKKQSKKKDHSKQTPPTKKTNTPSQQKEQHKQVNTNSNAQTNGMTKNGDTKTPRKQKKRLVTTVVQQVEYYDDQQTEVIPGKYTIMNNGEVHRKKPNSSNKGQMQEILSQLCSLIRALDVSVLSSPGAQSQ